MSSRQGGGERMTHCARYVGSCLAMLVASMLASLFALSLHALAQTAPASFQSPAPPNFVPSPNQFQPTPFQQPLRSTPAGRALLAAQPPKATPPAPATTSPTTPPAVSTTTPAAPAIASLPDVLAFTPEAIQTHLQQLQTATDLDPNLKQALVTAYEAILAETKKRIEEEKITRDFLAAYEAAPSATAEAKKRKENPVARATFADGALQSYKIETLQSLQLEIQSLTQSATDGRTRVEAAMTARDARRKEIPRLLTEDKAAIVKLNEELAAPPVEGTDPRLREANTLLARTKLASINDRIRRLEQEQRTYDAETELLPIRKELFVADEKYFQSKLKEVSEELSKRREILIANQKRLAERLTQQAAPELKSKADQIVKRSEDWLELAKQNASLRIEIESARGKQKLWADRYKIMTERISVESTRNVSKFNSWVGLMLRKQRNELPDTGRLNQQLQDYQTRILSTQTLILELDDWKASALAMSDDSSTANPMSSGAIDLFATLNTYEQQKILHALEHKLVDDFRMDANSYFENLFNLAQTNLQTIDQVNRYRAFIDEHVLWIRSSEPISKSDFKQLWPALRWFFDLQNWLAIPRLLIDDFRSHPWSYAVGLAAYLVLLINLKRFRKQVQTLGQSASKANCTSFLPTAKAVLLCFLLSSPLALLHLVVGWRLVETAGSNTFVDAIGVGLMISARYFFPLEMIRQISRTNGIAENHFQWSKRATQLLRRNLRWFIDIGIPAVSIVGIMAQYSEPKWENSLGRVMFVVLMALCIIYLLILLHPKHGVFSDFLSRNAGGWIDRLRYIWYFGFAMGPLALMTMSLMGYHYTALRLAMHLHTSFITLVGLLLVNSLICRWLLLRRRQIVVAQARQRLEEARRRDPIVGSIPNASASQPAPSFDHHTDLAQINAQTIRLVTSTLIFAAIGAIAFIWSGVLPAVGVLDSIQLWTVAGATANERIPVTLANLLLAIPAGIMTAVAARNLPGLLEIALLQHLPLENAVRYAISSLSRYTILILGIAMTFNSIGVRWASIQWLVAALGVGLGFGLQEIFANFVSGLILLFEQPIRVGDVITVGETTGKVSRIRMRATTVTNFDQQELVIPNKDLITGRLLNWTLSDSTNRMIIEVGIGYNSDPDLACELLTNICTNHPNVLKDPPPTAFFEQFGDSTLQLKARFFLANLDNRLPTRHDLHSQIMRKFAAVGIEISFPQRDLHIRSLPNEWQSTLTPTKGATDVQSDQKSQGTNQEVATSDRTHSKNASNPSDSASNTRGSGTILGD